jgi:hypothetical protein
LRVSADRRKRQLLWAQTPLCPSPGNGGSANANRLLAEAAYVANTSIKKIFIQIDSNQFP